MYVFLSHTGVGSARRQITRMVRTTPLTRTGLEHYCTLNHTVTENLGRLAGWMLEMEALRCGWMEQKTDMRVCD